jgi:N-acetylmuramic acid 6-phosphate etherase
MLIRLAGCDRDAAREALGGAGGSVKLALLLLRGCDLNTARSLLDRAGGQLRKALALMGQRGIHAA